MPARRMYRKKRTYRPKKKVDKNFKDQYGKIRVRMNDIMTARMFGNVGIASS
eukprot:COSAG02_NODE_72195_length_187_cov_40.772727_1_plen_51_part_10